MVRLGIPGAALLACTFAGPLRAQPDLRDEVLAAGQGLVTFSRFT
jgi:hypothetical protein